MRPQVMNQMEGPKSFRRLFAYPLLFTAGQLGVMAATGGTVQSNLVGYPSQITVLTHIGFVSTGPFLFQLTSSDVGGGLFQSQISSETLLGQLDRPGLLPIPIVMRGNETVRVDLTNDFGAASNAAKLTFWGYREIPKPGQRLDGCG